MDWFETILRGMIFATVIMLVVRYTKKKERKKREIRRHD